MQENILYVFPGQGSQYVGMGKDIFREFAVARHTFEQVSDIARRDIAKICFDGSNSNLNNPENTSLGTFAHSVAIARVIAAEFDVGSLYNISYAMAGHSMGQYSALRCAGSLDFADTVQILLARSSYMQRIAVDNGGMIAIVGIELAMLRQILAMAAGYGQVEISNHNAHNQFIVSGHNVALDAVLQAAKSCGARVARRLNVAVPAHCSLMRDAETLLRARLNLIQVNAPKTNWFSNHTADFVNNPGVIKELLALQMTHGVRWCEIMEKLPVYNITRAYELGPGQTLTKLINRANVGCVAQATDTLTNVKNVLNELNTIMGHSR